MGHEWPSVLARFGREQNGAVVRLAAIRLGPGAEAAPPDATSFACGRLTSPAVV